MIKRILLFFIALAFGLLGFNQEAKASHIAGADISYQCVGNDSFLITVNVFRDCSGISFNPTSINIDITNPCGPLNTTLTLQTTNQISGNNAIGIEVSQLCPQSLPNSSCNNGTLPGMELYTYQGIFVLNPPCSTWTFGYGPPPARNTNVNLGFGSGSAYVFTTMNYNVDSCNDSPEFSTDFPNPYSCVGQQVCYDYGVTENNGDSLVYSLIDAHTTSATATANYNAGYSGAVPIQGITINSQTGQLFFTPNIAGNFVVVVQICEYERGTGLLKGCVMRDMQFVVETCTNQAPSLCSADTIIAFRGTGQKVDSNTIEVCYGQWFEIDISIVDPDPNDSLTATSNIQQILPGATFNITHYNGGDSIIVTVGWTATLGANPFNVFNLQVTDNKCPTPATNSATFTVKVVPSTYAGPDRPICKGDSTNLNVIGGSTFTWSVINGDTSSLTCTTCPNLTVSPTTTTDYKVVSDLSASCKNTDTVRVVVSQPFSITMAPDTTICFNDSTISIFAFPSLPNRTYHYDWGPKSFVSSDTTQYTLATPILTKDYFVKITSDSGCVQRDTMNITVSPPFPSAISVTTNNSLACTGLSTQINLSLGSSPSSCGLSTSPCIGPEFTGTIGTQTNINTTSSSAPSTTAWPAPYGNSFGNVRQQFLIRANELQAAGMSAGKLTSLSFDLAAIAGTQTYFGFTIKMGCTQDSILNFWKSNLSTVFNSKTINLNAPGWQQHPFDNIYDWDGQSNLVVELCFANAGLPTSNSQTRYSNTSYPSALFFASNNQAACNANLVSAPPLSRRPNMQFDYCVAPDTNAYTYKWFPTTGLTDTLSLRPSATVNQTTTYYVQVKDTFEACVDTADITLNIADIDAGNDTAICPSDTLQLDAQITASCSGNSTLYWVPAVGLSNDSIPNPTVTIDSTTTYTVTFTDNCGCTVRDTITIFLGEVGTPVITKTDPDCGVDNGEYIFSLSGGFKPYNYTIDGGQTYQQSDSTFSNLAIGAYTLFVIDSLGCPSDTLIDTLANFGSPTLDSINVLDVNCFNAADGQIEVFASGGLQPTYYSIDSGSTYQTSNVFTNVDVGSYQVMVRSADSCTALPQAVSLSQPPPIGVNLQAYDDTCYQLGDGYAIAVGFGGVGGYEYLWSNNAPNDTLATGFFAGNYAVTVSDTNNCTVDTNFTIGEPVRVGIDSIVSTDITCNGYDNGRIQIFASGGNNIFRYSVDSGQTFQNNVNTFDSLAPGTYNIIVRDQSLCEITGQTSLVEPPVLEVSTNFDTTFLCQSNCVDLIATATGGNGGPYTYTWSPNLGNGASHNVCPEESITYAVYASDPQSCVSEVKTVDLILYDSLDVLIPEDTFFCFGSSIQLNAIPTGGDGTGYSFEWTPYQGLNNPKIPDPVAFPDTTTEYTITLNDRCGSPEIQRSVLIRVNPIPEIDFSIDTTEGCEPFYVRLNNNSTLQHNCWVNYGTGNTVNTCGDFFLEYVQEGKYDVSVRVRSKDGCENAKTIPELVTVFPKPTANFLMTPQPTSVLFPEITFEDVSKGKIVDYTWNFASFGSSKEQNPVFEFPDEDSATYPVRLTVVSNRECVDDTIQNVVIGQEYVMFVPSGFTPNGDGMNDIFRPEHTGVDGGEYTLVIFDRWGNEVFRSNDKNEGWDGTNQQTGEPALAGIYVWKLVVGDYSIENERHEYMGDITLMR